MVTHLDQLLCEIVARENGRPADESVGLFTKLLSPFQRETKRREEAPQGIYIYGAVGLFFILIKNNQTNKEIKKILSDVTKSTK